MTALTSEQRVRRDTLFQQLAQRIERVEELEDGYTFHARTDDSLWMTAAEFVDYERRCCPFFSFVLQMSSAADSIQLYLTGAEGTKEFIETQLMGNLPKS